jgi:hypothetical protein
MLKCDKRGLPMKSTIGMKYFTLLFLVLALSACTPSPDFELYEGKSLRIAVVGEPPKVKEEQVRFGEITFDEITSEEIGSYDAVLITEENLIKASERQYADIYLKSTIPVFFISANNHIPFTVEGVEYDHTWNWTAGKNYAVGVLTSQDDNTLKSWGYGLYNDEKTDVHIEDVYSRIFKTIDELNH